MRAEVEKINLRKELLDRRRKIFDKAKKDSVIFEKLIALPEFAKAELILTYVSTELEVDTRRLINYCFEKNIPAALPVIIDEKMKFFHLMKLWEIEKEVIDFTRSICVVPGLAFDKNNRRLGYGGGYYDRFLHDYQGMKIGLCYSEFVFGIPVENHDEQVDIVVTN